MFQQIYIYFFIYRQNSLEPNESALKWPLFDILFLGREESFLQTQPTAENESSEYLTNLDIVPELPSVDTVVTSHTKKRKARSQGWWTFNANHEFSPYIHLGPRRARNGNSSSSGSNEIEVSESDWEDDNVEFEEEEENVDEDEWDYDSYGEANAPGKISIFFYFKFLLHSVVEDEELTDDEKDDNGWIIKKRNFLISKSHSSAVLYLYKTFKFTADNRCGEEGGKIVDVVVSAKDSARLYFKFYNHENSRRAKNFLYILCSDLLTKGYVRWGKPDLTGKSLIGRRVQNIFNVEGKNLWYDGEIKNYDEKKKKYLILYCDGEETWVSLERLIPLLRRGGRLS